MTFLLTPGSISDQLHLEFYSGGMWVELLFLFLKEVSIYVLWFSPFTKNLCNESDQTCALTNVPSTHDQKVSLEKGTEPTCNWDTISHLTICIGQPIDLLLADLLTSLSARVGFVTFTRFLTSDLLKSSKEEDHLQSTIIILSLDRVFIIDFFFKKTHYGLFPNFNTELSYLQQQVYKWSFCCQTGES